VKGIAIFSTGQANFPARPRPVRTGQSKSGIFGEKFNETSRKKGFPIAKDHHRNKPNNRKLANVQ